MNSWDLKICPSKWTASNGVNLIVKIICHLVHWKMIKGSTIIIIISWMITTTISGILNILTETLPIITEIPAIVTEDRKVYIMKMIG